MIEIDVQKIVDEIKNEIEIKGYKSQILSFKEVEEIGSLYSTNFSLNELDSNISEANRLYYIEEYPIIWQDSLFQKITGFIKKVIRKTMKFYIAPMVEKQNKFNAAVTKSLNQVDSYIVAKEKKTVEYDDIKRLLQENENMQIVIQELSKTNEENNKRIQELESKVETLMLTDRLELR